RLTQGARRGTRHHWKFRTRHAFAIVGYPVDELMTGAAEFLRSHTARAGAIGRTNQAASAGSRMMAPSMFTKNMKVSMIPMSAWNCSGENTQVTTPMASVMPVKMMLAPVTRMVLK